FENTSASYCFKFSSVNTEGSSVASTANPYCSPNAFKATTEFSILSCTKPTPFLVYTNTFIFFQFTDCANIVLAHSSSPTLTSPRRVIRSKKPNLIVILNVICLNDSGYRLAKARHNCSASSADNDPSNTTNRYCKVYVLPACCAQSLFLVGAKLKN